MVNVQYVGGIGNNLFQYVAGRLIAKKLGLQFNTNFSGANFEDLAHYYQLQEVVNYGPSYTYPKRSTPPEAQTINWKDILGFQGNLLVRGYLQNVDIYSEDIDEIRSWFIVPEQYQADVSILHIRLGDYKQRGWVAPMSYYDDAIRCDSYEKDYNFCVVTDEPTHPFLSQLTSLKGFRSILDLPEVETFDLMVHCRSLIIPCSTFSWWAGIIGNVPMYMPCPAYGFWSPSDSVNLRLKNECVTIINSPPTISLPKGDGGGFFFNQAQRVL